MLVFLDELQYSKLFKIRENRAYLFVWNALMAWSWDDRDRHHDAANQLQLITPHYDCEKKTWRQMPDQYRQRIPTSL